ncbi:hypothetical protein [Streptomyces sp. NPDC088141]|uniref:hypothetical protein n=1 Tax=unclassified Streptomyces TaxID=2593676 RepID=UPI00344933FE
MKDAPQFAPSAAAAPLIMGDLALTTTRIGNTSTAEVARRQDDGTWRWVIDRPDVLLASEL